MLHGAPLPKLVRELGIKSTVHGFRSACRDCAPEMDVDRVVAEAALAHTVGGVEGAYLRSDLFAWRRNVVQGWGDYLGRRGAADLWHLPRWNVPKPSGLRTGACSAFL